MFQTHFSVQQNTKGEFWTNILATLFNIMNVINVTKKYHKRDSNDLCATYFKNYEVIQQLFE